MNRTQVIGLIVGVAIIGILSFVFLGNNTTPQENSKLQVAASFYPLYFFAQQIGGEKTDVVNVTPSGGEPHDYEPTAQDIARIEGGKLLILNGGGLESWGEKIKQNIDPNKTIVVTAGEGLTTQQVVEDGETITDPHVWLSPVLAEQMVDKIEAGFAQVDPTNADYYAQHAATLKAELGKLDTKYRQGLASCKSKDIITSHAAFGYLGATYGLNQVAISGISPEEEPSSKQLADIANFAKKNNVKYIFFESLVSPKLSQTIATEVGAQTLVLDPIEGIASDEIAKGATYFSVMENNLVNLRTALQCN